MEEKEEWKVYHKGPKVIWEVSSEGRVKRNNYLYKPKIYKGYFVVGCGSVHRMVAKCFIPNPNNYNEVDHINGDKTDNRVCNLRWCNHKENINNPITRKRLKKAMEDPETRKRISKSMKGKSQSEEIKQKISITTKKAMDNPEVRQKCREVHKDTHRVYHEDGTWHMEKNTQNITMN